MVLVSRFVFFSMFNFHFKFSIFGVWTVGWIKEAI